MSEIWKPVLRLIIPAIVAGKPRPRSTVRNGRAVIYDVRRVKKSDGRKVDHPSVVFSATIRHAVTQVFKAAPLEGPLRLDLVFVTPRPNDMVWKTRPMPRVPHTGKPDRDNADKLVMDALTKIVWKDDAQIFFGTLEKWVAAGNEQPHVELALYEYNAAALKETA